MQDLNPTWIAHQNRINRVILIRKIYNINPNPTGQHWEIIKTHKPHWEILRKYVSLLATEQAGRGSNPV
jgi:hypothetical protein